MSSFLWRGWSPDTPCKEYAKLQQVAEELLANIGETTSPAQFEQAQKSLLFLFHEYNQRMDPLHPRFPGGHRCLEHCYLEYAMRLRNRAIFHKPLPPSPQPPPPAPPRSLSDVVQDFAGMTDEDKPDGE